MGATDIRSCSCMNEFQDEKYGKGQRLMNKSVKGYRCTVCGRDTVVTSSSSTPTKGKK